MLIFLFHSWKWKIIIINMAKNSTIVSSILYLLNPREFIAITGMNTFHTGIYNEKIVWFGHFLDPSHKFSTLSSTCNVKSLDFYFWLCNETWQATGVFQKRKLVFIPSREWMRLTFLQKVVETETYNRVYCSSAIVCPRSLFDEF